MWFLLSILKIPWTKIVKNDEVVEEIGIKLTLILNISERELKSLEYIIRK